MSDINLNPVGSGFNRSRINNNFEVIEEIVNNGILHLEGGNNIMKQNLDMDSNRILNLPNPVDDQEPVPYGRLLELLGISGNAVTVPLVQPRQIGDGTTTVFNTPSSVEVAPEALFVFIDGVKQRPVTDYTVNGTGQVVFTEAPALNTNIDITFYTPLLDVTGETAVVAEGTTTPRTLASRFGEFINVEDFGADPTGVEDSYAAFASAVATGKKVVGSSGATYRLNSALTDMNYFDGRGCKVIANSGFVDLDRSSSYLAPTQDYVAGDREYKVSSTAGIEDGSILSLRSTELYNTERSYYYEGCNSKVSVVDGTTLALSLACPFDITQAQLADNGTTGAYLYSPKTVKMQDFALEGNKTATSGIYIEGCSVLLDNVKVSGYTTQGIGLRRCVGVNMNSCETYNTSTYGAVLYSCSEVLVTNGNYTSDGVGFDTGGNEPLFGCKWVGGNYVSLNGGKGLSMHANMWSADIINCDVQGINLSGKCTVQGGTLTSEVDQGSNYFYMHVGNKHQDNSYTFRGVHFERYPTIRLAGQSQVTPTGRNKLDSLILENCTGQVALYLDLALTSSLPDRCNIKNVKLINSNANLTHRDDIEFLEILNNKNDSIYRTIEQLPNVTTPDGYIHRFRIADGKMSVLAEDIQIGRFDYGIIENVELEVPGTSFRIQDSAGGGILSFRDCQFSNNSVFRTDGLLRLLSDNTQITINAAYTPNITTYIQRDEY